MYSRFEDNIFPLNILNNSCNKTQQDALFSRFIFDKELCMFRTDLLPIIRSLNIVYAATGICHASYVGCLLAWSADHASRHPTELA